MTDTQVIYLPPDLLFIYQHQASAEEPPYSNIYQTFPV